MRPGYGRTRTQQDERIEQRQLHRVEYFETLGRPLHQRSCAILPYKVGNRESMRFSVLYYFQRHRKQRIIEPGPEPANKKHHFGCDKQDHPVAQMELHHRRMIASMRFIDDVGPPRVEGIDNASDSETENQTTISAKKFRLEHHYHAEKHGERRQRSHQRRNARRQYVIIVVLGAGHGLFPVTDMSFD